MLRKLLLSAFFLCLAGASIAQAPQALNYQAVARDGTGNLLVNQNASVRYSVHDGSAGGTVVYSETHSVTTNQFGLFTASVGSGTPVSGTFASIDWSTGSKFLQVELDLGSG